MNSLGDFQETIDCLRETIHAMEKELEQLWTHFCSFRERIDIEGGSSLEISKPDQIISAIKILKLLLANNNSEVISLFIKWI